MTTSAGNTTIKTSSSWRRFPIIYEINTWTWLHGLSEKAGSTITLADVPESALDELAGWGFDAVWLMGVWERSPRGREIARTLSDLQAEYARALPGYSSEDVVGSPYAVHRYSVDSRLGGPDGLAAFRKRLAARKLRLLLDYVPNHVAVDHPWTRARQTALVNGTLADLNAQPDAYFAVDHAHIFAYGRDPYFPPWSDTAQINAFAHEARQAARETLLDLAGQCDGVRCDMAMLLLNRVFSQTWKYQPPPTEFWEDVIPVVRQQHPDFLFIAEAYWNTEAELHALGFDGAYDKRLYDRLHTGTAADVRDHLLAGFDYQRRMVRFVENHDEQRAVVAFGLERSRAAAALAVLLPGIRLLHEGQLEGRRVKLPVQLGRRPAEQSDQKLSAFYQSLLAEAAHSAYHDGTYLALAVNPILGSDSGHESVIAFAWAHGSDWAVVAVNLGFQPIQARLMIPDPVLSSKDWTLVDALSGETSHWRGDDLLTTGLPLALNAYGLALLTVRRLQPTSA